MVSHNCPAISQNPQILVEQLLIAASFGNIKGGGLSNVLSGSSSQTLKKHCARLFANCIICNPSNRNICAIVSVSLYSIRLQKF